MRSNDFYEKLEDGFTTLEGEPDSRTYQAPGETATLDELLRDSNHTRRQAKQTTGKNQENWQRIANETKIRYTEAWGSPKYQDERKQKEELTRIHNSYSMEGN